MWTRPWQESQSEAEGERPPDHQPMLLANDDVIGPPAQGEHEQQAERRGERDHRGESVAAALRPGSVRAASVGADGSVSSSGIWTPILLALGAVAALLLAIDQARRFRARRQRGRKGLLGTPQQPSG